MLSISTAEDDGPVKKRIGNANASLSPKQSNAISQKLLSPKREKRMSYDPTNGRDDFYQKFQTLGRQRQIAQVSQDDPSKLMVVQHGLDSSYGLLSPEKKTLRRLRSRTLPDMQSPGKDGGPLRFEDDTLMSPGGGLMSPGGNATSPIPARVRKGERQKVSSNVVGKAGEAALSPRSKYIEACMREGLNPRASLVLKQKTSRELHLQHQVG